MASDTSIHVDAKFICKWITVGKLKKLLEDLDDRLELHSNRVGNLSIIDPVDRTTHGYVDIAEEVIDYA